MPTGAGKCHPAGTSLILHNGNPINVEDVRAGDLLMGPDSLPRRVTSTNRGHGDIYRITPEAGPSWQCNYHHVLTLARNPDKLSQNAHRLRDTIDVPLADYLDQRNVLAGRYQLFQPPSVQFPRNAASGARQPLDPYTLGTFLATGAVGDNPLALNLAGRPTLAAAHAFPAPPELAAAGYRPKGDSATAALRSLRLLQLPPDRRFVPRSYRTATPSQRLEILAAFIDAAGDADSQGHSFTTRNPRLTRDLLFIARSLGFRATANRHPTGPPTSSQISITGPNHLIPCRVPRNCVPERASRQSPLLQEFDVSLLGQDHYYGFTLDGDGRYLLENFTVTHNTVSFAEIARRAVQKNRPVSIIVHRQELITQSANAVHRQTGIEPGIVWSSRREWDRPITIISHGTIQVAEPPPNFRPHILILDEAHHATADGWQHAIQLINPRYLIGFTATPFRQDREPLFPKPFAKIIRPITPQELIDLGILCPAVIESPIVTDAATGLPLPPNRASNLPAVYLKAINHALARGKSKIILFVSGTQSLTPLQVIDATCALLNARGISAGAIRDGMNASDRAGVIRRFQNNASASVICNYMALTEGFDAPEVDCVIVGRTTQSESTIIQMIGRGLRQFPSKSECLVINYTGRTDMEDIIHYWRIDEPKPENQPAIRDKPLRTPKELSQLSTQFTLELGPVNHDQAAYPWFRPFPTRPLMALAVCGPQGASDTYVTIEPDRNDLWATATVSLHSSGPSPVSVNRKSGLTAQEAAANVRAALGPTAPSILRSAPWRQKPASTQQITAYRSATKNDPPDGITAGEASDAIAAARFALRKLQKLI